MKTLLFVLSLFLFYGKVNSAPIVLEAPIKDVGTPVTVSISTITWTKVPTSQTSGRTGVLVNLPATAAANMVGHLGDCTSTAIATTIRPIEIIKGEDYSNLALREDICLWVLSIHTAAESLHYQEIKQ